jgi:signal transduction histidine kinase/ActR/RegA family two-component response regulator
MTKRDGRREHLVHFYEDDQLLIDRLGEFVATGLKAGEAALIIATAEHRAGLDERLRGLGWDVDEATATGQFLAVDAAGTLARIVVDGAPDEGRFRDVVGELLGRVGGSGPTRVFGEMVGVLLSAGNAPATIRLEELWNQLLADRAFSLFCAYPMRQLGGQQFAEPVAAVCRQHDRIVPAESYPRDEPPRGRLSAIVALQQQASSLRAEVAERGAVETALRAVTAELEEQVADLRRLHEMSARLTSTLDLEPLLREVLDAVLAVQGTGMGLLALCDPETPLTLRVHRGFDEAFVEEIERVPFGGGAWGIAYTERRPVVVEDTETDPVFAPYRDAARRAGFRACQSTPLFTRGGDVIGVLSVHFGAPRRVAESETRLIDLYVRIAADAIENAQLHERLQKELDERRESLAREHTARAHAEIANRMKDEFLANVSHELRTPLNAVLGWAHILRTGRPDEATLARGVEVIERNAQAQAKLIEDILDASRAITGTLSINRSAVDLGAVINAATDSVRAAAQRKGIALTVILDPIARHVSGDAGRLQQAVWNVLSNAIKFTHRGGKVEVRLARTDGHARITVTDTGEGIPSDFLPFVFERFRQGDPTITRRHGGLGLGLSIVRHLVELHGGTVHADSAGEGYGTTVGLDLPLDGAGEAEAAGTPAPAPPLRGVQVLVVDDDHDALDMLARLLTDAGAAVRTAASATEAMSLLRWIRPDVLVSDLAMPDEDGYSLIRNVRAAERGTDRETPAVALTAYVRLQDRARAVAAGFNMFVEKPVDPDELISVIGGIVDSRGGPREERRARSDAPAH